MVEQSASGKTEPNTVARFKPDRLLDACGLHCPLPLLKAKQALADLMPGQLLEIRATDAGSWRDMASFTELSDHVLEAREQHDDVYYFWIRKAGKSHS
ncbi:sulfurtransferase TusA family protein [Vreelandella alkaliphila]|uniref:Sulfurtransferase TusA family protein n=1 Tax=Vreelandella alkaliphila TaxID=272774 RepID=A0A7C9JT87_9GAMM|nr:sulfurtransferase TusA family protein [Halomonas alkaliphila]NDL71064.1 sulfurtransferase TusA family protein [Halomonas alkaliphila]